MTVESLIDLYGFSWGFFLFELLYELCQTTGLIFLGFIKLYASYAIKVTESAGEDWDAKSALPSVQVKTIAMFCTMIFCFVPLYPMEVSEIKIVERQCEAGTDISSENTTGTLNNQGEASATLIDKVDVMFGGAQINTPMSFKLLFWLAQWMKDETIRRIPCNTDLRLFSEKLDLEKINDPRLREEVIDFQKMCYRPAIRKAERNQEFSEDMTWLGSTTFMTDPKYYQGAEKDGFYSTKPIRRFDASDNHTSEGDALPEGSGGYPSCYVWWNGDKDYGSELEDLGKGLGSQLFNSIDENLRRQVTNQNLIAQRSRLVHGTGIEDEEWDNAFVSFRHQVLYLAYFTPKKMDLRQASNFTDYTLGTRGDGGVMDGVGSFLGWAGMASDSLSRASGATMIQKAMPMVKPFIIAVILFVASFLFVLSGYKGSVVFTVHVAIGTILYWPAIWAFARNVDDNAREVLGLSFATTDNMLIQALSWSLFALAPMMFTSMMSWAGFNAATGIESFAGKGVTSAAGSAGKNVGSKAQSNIGKAGKKAVTKGKK